MFCLGLSSTLVGLGLMNPYINTFQASPAWRYIDDLRYGWLQPNETMWGALFTFVGVSQLYRVKVFQVAVESGPSNLRNIALGSTRIIYAVGAILWVGVGLSWFFSNPGGVAVLVVIPLHVVLGFYVALMIGRIVDSLEGEGGP